jgi:hypothetical protein
MPEMEKSPLHEKAANLGPCSALWASKLEGIFIMAHLH